MLSRSILVLGLSTLALSAEPALAQFKKGGTFGDPAARFGWLPSRSAGKAEAKKTGKPMMVVLRCVP